LLTPPEKNKSTKTFVSVVTNKIYHNQKLMSTRLNS
jgi:hypothetical protein